MKNVFHKIQAICENATGNIYDIYFTLYRECLMDQCDGGIALQKILSEVQNVEFVDDGDSRCINEADVKEITDLYFDLLRIYVRTLARENLEETEFYKRLYEMVFESGLFPQKETIRGVLLYLLAEKIPEIPYFHATNLLKMTSEDYKEAVQRLRPYIDRAICVLNRHFKSRTEESSQIFEIISSLENREDKIVFLSVFINIIQRNTISSVKDDEKE